MNVLSYVVSQLSPSKEGKAELHTLRPGLCERRWECVCHLQGEKKTQFGWLGRDSGDVKEMKGVKRELKD